MDDILVVNSDPDTVKGENQALCERFILEDLGKASEFIGIALVYDDDRISLTLSQATSIRRSIEKVNLHNYKPASTPIESQIYDDLRAMSELAKNVPYRK